MTEEVDDEQFKHKTYDFLELQHVRYTLISVIKAVQVACVLLLIFVPFGIGYVIAQLFNNATLIFWTYLPFLVVLTWLLYGFLENCPEAVRELERIDRIPH